MKRIRDQLLQVFAADEPEYDRAIALGAAALPSLRKMVERDETHVAAAAAYVAGQIPRRESLDVIARASRRRERRVRAAAAGALRDFAMHPHCAGELEGAFALIEPLLRDDDASVRKFAHRAMAVLPAGTASHQAGRNAGS